jgi:hypothetical protein
MERYVVDNDRERVYRKFFQTGGEIDGYIYNQEGEGIGSLFGNLFKKVLPFVTKAIKGAATIAGPHLKQAATEITGEASKSFIRSINNRKRKAPTSKRTPVNLNLKRKRQL